MVDKLRSSPGMALWHLAGSYADKPAVLWPGGDKHGAQEGVKPVAEALVMITHREEELTAGKLDEVQLLLQEGEEPILRTYVRIEAHIDNMGGVVTATAGEIQMSKQMGQEAARQVYDHYLEKYGGQSIHMLSKREMQDTLGTMLLEDALGENL